MDNSVLWSFAIISGVANVVFYYLFWRAIKENHKLAEQLMERGMDR